MSSSSGSFCSNLATPQVDEFIEHVRRATDSRRLVRLIELIPQSSMLYGDRRRDEKIC